jgi:uncharacterized membrane protein YfcA
MEFIRIIIGLAVLVYVAYCLVNQKVWIRKDFAWKTREEYPKVFMMNVIGGTVIGLLMMIGQFY